MAFTSLKQLWFCEREKGGTCSLSVPLSSPLLLLKPLFLKSYKMWAKKDHLIHCTPRGRILSFSCKKRETCCYSPAGDVAVVNRRTCGRAAIITKGQKNWEREELQCLNVVGGGGSEVRYPCPRAGHRGYQG